MQRRTLLVAVAEVEFLGLPARFSGERIVLRHTAVVVQPDDRARMVARPLRALHLAAVAQREIDVARAIEHDAPAEVVPGPALRALPEKHLHVLEAVAGEPAAREL